MPSQGLTIVAASSAIGRAPGLSSRVKQSCTLLNSDFFASLRSRSEKVFHRPSDNERTSGCSMGENQPMNKVAPRRGIRLVSRKPRDSSRFIGDVTPLKEAGNRVLIHEP